MVLHSSDRGRSEPMPLDGPERPSLSAPVLCNPPAAEQTTELRVKAEAAYVHLYMVVDHWSCWLPGWNPPTEVMTALDDAREATAALWSTVMAPGAIMDTRRPFAEQILTLIASFKDDLLSHEEYATCFEALTREETARRLRENR